MKAWVLGVALLSATGGGVAFVLASKDRAAGEPGLSGRADAVRPCGAPTPSVECAGCRATPTDLADVSVLLARAEPARPGVSFDEPPFAQPIRVRAQQPDIETAPMPRPLPTAEEAPMPRPVG